MRFHLGHPRTRVLAALQAVTQVTQRLEARKSLGQALVTLRTMAANRPDVTVLIREGRPVLLLGGLSLSN
jgi:hypothetical protein